MAKPRLSIVWQIMIGLVLGILLGLLLNHAPEYKTWLIPNILKPAGDIFIQMMKMIVVPIVFSCLVGGIARMGGGSLGRIGVKTLVYFFSVTSVAILFGLIIGNVIQPGSGADIIAMKATVQPSLPSAATSSQYAGLGKIIMDIIPDNIISAMAQGKLLSVIFFAVMFGLALSSVPEEKRIPIVTILDGVAATMFKVTGFIIAYSPIGIFGMIAVTISNFGLASLLPLLKLIVTTYIAVILFGVVVLGAVAKFAVGLSIFDLMRVFKAELILAFSTAASTTVLPQLIKKTEDAGAPGAISSFVVPTGYSFNLDGASLFLGIGCLFIAQLYGIVLPWADQAILVVTMVLTSKGAAGVPGFMFVILTATLGSVGLPLEGIAFIAGVYRLMDMPITALNVLGNALAPLVVSKWESVFDRAKFDAYLASQKDETKI